MRKIIQLGLVFIFSFLFSFSSKADNIYAVQDGDWQNPNTWNLNRIPGNTDDVFIQGFTIYVSPATGNVEINNLNISNKIGGSTTNLSIDGSVVFTVKGNLIANANNVNKDVEIQLFNEALLKIDGDATFRRSGDNLQSNKLKLNVQDQSGVQVGGDFIFDYKNASTTENSEEVFLNNGALLAINGTVKLYLREGQDFNFDVYNNSTLQLSTNLDAQMLGGKKFFFDLDATSTFSARGDLNFLLSDADDFMNLNLLGTCDFGGNVKLQSEQSGKSVNLVVDGEAATMDVEGDFLMSATGAGDVALALQKKARMNLGGNFLRPTDYGTLLMDASSTLILDGDQQQEVPSDAMPDGGSDRFTVTNILFENTSGEPMLLTGFLTIKEELKLTEGIIKVNEGGAVIVEDGVMISGGSPFAYIDGAITKRGSTNGDHFVFPTGDGDVYAPLEISPLTHPDDEIMIQYRDDPPPIEEKIKSPVSRVSGRGYWSIRRTPGSTIPDVTLNWMDAAARGIDNMEDAVVAFVDTSSNSNNPEWMSLGKSESTGAVGVGISGSITNSLDDPPPIEDHGLLTIGFTNGPSDEEIVPLSGSAVIPVELTIFKAKQFEKVVNVEWETNYESNNHSFVVERSSNCMDFTSIVQMPARGEIEIPSRYATTDLEPHIGQNYYRLKIVNVDGSFHYSHTVSVFINTFEEPRLYPNPVRDELHLFLGENLSEAVDIQIFDQLGRVIFSGKLPLENGELMLSTDQMNIREGGNYYLRVNFSKGHHQSFRFNKSY